MKRHMIFFIKDKAIWYLPYCERKTFKDQSIVCNTGRLVWLKENVIGAKVKQCKLLPCDQQFI